MLVIDNISFAMAGRPLIEHASARIATGQKIGLVGPNGAGKTTLFRLIKGELSLDGGQITLPQRARIGAVAQEAPGGTQSLISWVLEADTERTKLLAEAETATDPDQIATLHNRLADIDAYSAEARAATILDGLGFNHEAQLRPLSEFSGGWRMRVALAAVLFSRPDLLLLDEPTNYLDLEGTLWLRNYLAKYPSTTLVISHDRDLLNHAVGAILHLHGRELTLWPGNFDAFVAARAEKARLAEAEAKKAAAKRAHLQSFIDRFRAKASKAKQAQSRVKMLEKMGEVRLITDEAQSRFTFADPEPLSPPILALRDVNLGYAERTVLRRLDLRIDQDDRIALLGRNGQGKSTLAKALAGALAPQSGEIVRSSKLRIGYFAQHQLDMLTPDETPLAHLQRLRPNTPPVQLRATLAGFGLMAAQAELACKQLSGGQRARLALALVTLDKPHLLILDEPTNHLDMESREALIEALAGYQGAVVLVAHDMHLLSLVADRLWLVENGGVRIWEDDLDAYRHALLQGSGKATENPKTVAQPKAKDTKRAAKAEREHAEREVKRAEERLAKLDEMRAKLHDRMGDQALYSDPNRADELAVLQAKHAELEAAYDKAELLWMQAEEALETAEHSA